MPRMCARRCRGGCRSRRLNRGRLAKQAWQGHCSARGDETGFWVQVVVNEHDDDIG